jgi:hypothetical protein
MKKYLFLSLGLCLTTILIFQNCEELAYNAKTGNVFLKAPSIGEDYSWTQVDFGGDISWREKYSIDLSDGAIYKSAINDNGTPSDDRVKISELADQDLSELNNLLASSQICIPIEKEVDETMLCTMVYSYPYATLIGESSTQGPLKYPLGEKWSGCDIPTDLCEQRGEQLKDFLQKIQETF